MSARETKETFCYKYLSTYALPCSFHINKFSSTCAIAQSISLFSSSSYALISFHHISRECIKSVCIRSYSSPYFPVFGLNTERCSVSLRIQSERGKIRTRIIPNTATVYAVRNINISYQITDVI